MLFPHPNPMNWVIVLLIWLMKESQTSLEPYCGWVNESIFIFWLNYSFKSVWKRCTKDWLFLSFHLIYLIHYGKCVKWLSDPSVWMNTGRTNRQHFRNVKENYSKKEQLLVHFAKNVLEWNAVLCRRRSVSFALILLSDKHFIFWLC